MIKNNLFALCILTILVSCKNEVSKKESTQATAVQYNHEFVMENFTDTAMDIPHSIVMFGNGSELTRIDTTTGTFQIMTAAEKAQEKLPASCVVAGSAFWAGLRQIIVIDSTADGFIIKRQYQDSESEDIEPFEVVRKFPK